MGDITCRNPVFVGIDPGRSGGIAAVASNGWVTATDMPDTDRDILSWLADFKGVGSFAVLEKVHSMPGQGVSSTFKFGVGYGGIRMALTALSVPFEEVLPSVWLRGLGIPPRKRAESRTEWKNRLKARAQQLYPSEKVTLATADALLIATYCMRVRTGTL